MVSKSMTSRQSGDFIKRLRKELKLSQEKTAQYAKVSPVTLRNYENGKTVPNASTAERIEVTLKYLYLVTKLSFSEDSYEYIFLKDFSPDFKKTSGRERLEMIDELNLIFDRYADVDLLMGNEAQISKITGYLSDEPIKPIEMEYTVSSLDPDEIRLVYLFRQLKDDEKNHILRYISYTANMKHIYHPTEEELAEITELYESENE